MDSENNSNIPISDLDLQAQLTNPLWGKDLNDQLKAKLYSIIDKKLDESTGEETVTVENLWNLLNFYTRDMRLANLSLLTGEYEYTRKYLDLAGDCLSSGYIKGFITALSRVITILELSQSKNGFFRRRSNTLTNENYISPLEPNKKGLFGGSKPKDDNRGRYV